MAKRLLIVLAICLAFAGQAWAGPADGAPAVPASGKKTPIIDVVAVAPADPVRLFPPSSANGPDLRLDPGLAQTLNLTRKPESERSPLAIQAGPLSGQFQTFSDSALDRRLEGMRQPGSYQYDPRLDDQEQQGGFLALRWKASSSSEITLGGGYTRSYNAVSTANQGSAAAVRGGSALSTTRSDSGATSTEANGRWGAFLAVPYKLGKNVGVRPEVTYYHGELPDAGRDSTNEWVMGLRFTFGF